MSDLLIRDVPQDVLSGLDRRASELGLSRVEFVRRTLARESLGKTESVTETHLANLLDLLPDLDDAEIMASAWR